MGATGTDDTIHLEVTEVSASVKFLRAILDTDSPGMVMEETLMNRFFYVSSEALEPYHGEDANNALINVIVDCTGAERAVDAVSDEYLTGGIGGVLELPCYELRELRGKLVIGADL